MVIKTVLIDDEAWAIEALQKDLLELFPSEIKILGSTNNAREAIFMIKELMPDIVFLDIDLGNSSGFDVLEELETFQKRPNVIFVTAFNQFAIKAIKKRALDYLLKPIDKDELKQTIEYYINTQLNKDSQTITSSNDVLVLNTQEKIHFCPYSDIIRCQAERNYTRFFIQNSNPILVSKTIGDFEDILIPQKGFIRPHKAHIINTKFIDSYLKRDGGGILMKDQTIVPLALNKKDQLIDFFSKNK